MKKYINYAKTLTELMGSLGLGATKKESVGSMGFNQKKCKSCKDFAHCHRALNRKPMDNACKEYKPKKGGEKMSVHNKNWCSREHCLAGKMRTDTYSWGVSR